MSIYMRVEKHLERRLTKILTSVSLEGRNAVLCVLVFKGFVFFLSFFYLSLSFPLPLRYILLVFSSVQSLSRVWLFVTPWTAARQSSLSIINSWSLLKLIHWVGDAIQPSHPLSSPSPPAFNHSQHQGLFKWVSSLHQVTKVLELQLQHQSFQGLFILFLLGWIGWISLQV